jgi:rSAM/selenodomain-associated transferase 2
MPRERSAPEPERGGGADATIAVIVPTLNEEATIQACLAAVGLEAGVEAVVSDGGSDDKTLSVVREGFPLVRVVRGPRGRGGQLNRGARILDADILLFVHADCRLPAGWPSAVRAALGDPAVALGCFRLHTEPPVGRNEGSLARLWWRLLDVRGRGFLLPYGDQALFVRREVFDAVGGFADIPLMEDVAFVRSCLRRGRLARLPLEVRTAARRFARYPVRARVCTAMFPLLFRMGVSPQRLSRWYGEGR